MNERIEKELKKHEEYLRRLMALDGAVNSVESVLSNAPQLQGSISASIGYGVYMGIDVWVDSLREIPALMRSLARHGIRIDKDRKPSSDKAGRTYRLLVETPYATGHKEQVTLCAYVRNAVAQCKYVKTGEKTVDIMEWQCS